MSQFGGAKNPPWIRQGQQMGMPVSQQNQMQPQMMSQIGNTATMLQYPQAQMFQQPQLSQLQQGGMTMSSLGGITANQLSSSGGLSTAMPPPTNAVQQQQMYSQAALQGTVSYPTRTILTGPAPYGGTGGATTGAVSGGVPAGQSNQGAAPKQRVFTGTVTKVQDNFGFVDEEVFFQSSCCVKGLNPQVGDRVLVEAMYNATMPFKWNATRIQVLPMETSPMNSGGNRKRFSSYNSVPPPTENMMVAPNDNRDRRMNRNKRDRRDDNDFAARKKRREEAKSIERPIRDDKEKEREKERPERPERPKSPPRSRRSKTPRRKKARIVPRYMVQIPKIALDMPEGDVLEVKKRYNNLYIPSDFFVASFKWVEGFPPHRPLTLDRPCAFHVMHKDVDPIIDNDAVLDPPDADYLFCAKVMLLSMPELNDVYQKCCALADEKEGSDDRDCVHPTRLINFLVGIRGKNETMAIGGPWSPSLDGKNPEKDPTVLIKTAIRNCRALTGIDLSNCSQWYRFLEIYYHRAESVHKGKTVPARVETVVLYLPDVWSCLPTRLEWDGLHLNYKKQLDGQLNQDEDPEPDEKDTSTSEGQKKEPTHFSQLDPKVMKVNELRDELEARSLSSKGLKSQLTARLAKALKAEQDKEEEETKAKNEAAKNEVKNEKDEKEEERRRKEEENKKRLDEKERALLEKRYTLPEKSHIVVHPSRIAKSGKFDCTVMSLSVLLDYRPEDSKEHSFEVSLFAELFNEMLMRDFGFCIYKAFVAAPEKPKEEKEDKKKSDKDKKDDKKDEKKDDKKEEKKDDKNSVEDDEASGDDDDSKKSKKGDDKKKKDRVKRITVDPYLLLAFVYFDQTHCGYIFDKDLEDLLFTLGLNLSRAQVKKLVQKIISRDSLHYRKLTDKTKDEANSKQNEVEDLATLSQGNKKLFPIFDEGSDASSKRNRKSGSESKGSSELPAGYVMYNGSLLDINKLQSQLKRSEDSRHQTEKALENLRYDHDHLKDSNSRNVSSLKKVSTELKDFKEKLANTSKDLCCVDAKTKHYFTVMSEIYEKLTPIVAVKQNVKDEIIEDVEMEDAEDRETGKKESTDGDSKTTKTSIPVKSSQEDNEKDVKQENGIKTENMSVKAKTEETKVVASEEKVKKPQENQESKKDSEENKLMQVTQPISKEEGNKNNPPLKAKQPEENKESEEKKSVGIKQSEEKKSVEVKQSEEKKSVEIKQPTSKDVASKSSSPVGTNVKSNVNALSGSPVGTNVKSNVNALSEKKQEDSTNKANDKNTVPAKASGVKQEEKSSPKPTKAAPGKN